MTKTHEKLLVAALAGMIIAGAALFAIQPAVAQSFGKSPSLLAPAQQVLTLRLADTV
jgi:hypothetical protein